MWEPAGLAYGQPCQRSSRTTPTPRSLRRPDKLNVLRAEFNMPLPSSNRDKPHLTGSIARPTVSMATSTTCDILELRARRAICSVAVTAAMKLVVPFLGFFFSPAMLNFALGSYISRHARLVRENKDQYKRRAAL